MHMGAHVSAVEVPDVDGVVLRAADYPLALLVCHRQRREYAVLLVHVPCAHNSQCHGQEGWFP